MKKITWILSITLFCFFCNTLIAQNYATAIGKQLKELSNQDKLSSQDIQWVLNSQHKSPKSGVTHAYYRQKLNGLEVYGTESGIHFLSNGKVVSQDNKFIKNISQKTLGSTSPAITAIEAVRSAAAQLGYVSTQPIKILEKKDGNNHLVLSGGGISSRPINAKLMYSLTADNKVILAWDVSIKSTEKLDEWWSLRVDANTGSIVDRANWIVSCNINHVHDHDKTLDYNSNLYDIPNYQEAEKGFVACVNCYEIIELPNESPYYTARSIVTDPANALASPFGWHDTDGMAGAEFTDTRGNNVDAYEVGTNHRPDGGADLDFTGYDFNQTYTNANQYASASVTNLFYLNNIIHDVVYQYGFDEESGNFQEENYSNTGLGGDSVEAQGQLGILCNAFFGTPPDGQNPTMEMYVCGDKDGDFDALVVLHEFTHGISNRLTGGSANASCLNPNNTPEQMGEGWSDFYGIVMTIEPGDAGTDRRPVGTYLFGQGINGSGIRQYPYSTDMTINPHTYNSIKSGSVPHGVGSVWAAMVWDMTWGLIDAHGFNPNIYEFTGDVAQDAGNIMAIALVTEGMKLQPCRPGFVDGRDAILAADQALYGGANQCIIWEAFAKRGLGFSADQGTSSSRSDGTEAFDMPGDITCPADITVQVPMGQQYTLLDYSGDTTATSLCNANPLAITQDPVAGTMVGAGDTIITMTATDSDNNEYTCTFKVTVEEILGIDESDFTKNLLLYPNPTSGKIALINNTNSQLNNAVITDIKGRTIHKIDLTNAGIETNFSLENLASGMYFIKINAENNSVVKRIIKL